MASDVNQWSDLIDRFSAGDNTIGANVLADVREYLLWQSERGEAPFL